MIEDIMRSIGDTCPNVSDSLFDFFCSVAISPASVICVEYGCMATSEAEKISFNQIIRKPVTDPLFEGEC